MRTNDLVGYSLKKKNDELSRLLKKQETELNVVQWSISQMKDSSHAIKKVKDKHRSRISIPAESANSSDHQEYVNLCTNLNNIGYFVDFEFVCPEKLRTLFGPTFVICWTMLEKFVYEYRKKYSEPSELSANTVSFSHFESLAKYFIEKKQVEIEN